MKNKILFFLLFILFPSLVFAQGGIKIENPLRAESFNEIINSLINFFLNIAIALTPLMIIWAAFLFVTSAGNPLQVDKAKRIIIYTLIGLAVILFAKGFIAIIKQIIS